MPIRPSSGNTLTVSASNPQMVFFARLQDRVIFRAGARPESASVDITMSLDGEVEEYTS